MEFKSQVVSRCPMVRATHIWYDAPASSCERSISCRCLCDAGRATHSNSRGRDHVPDVSRKHAALRASALHCFRMLPGGSMLSPHITKNDTLPRTRSVNVPTRPKVASCARAARCLCRASTARNRWYDAPASHTTASAGGRVSVQLMRSSSTSAAAATSVFRTSSKRRKVRPHQCTLVARAKWRPRVERRHWRYRGRR